MSRPLHARPLRPSWLTSMSEDSSSVNAFLISGRIRSSDPCSSNGSTKVALRLFVITPYARPPCVALPLTVHSRIRPHNHSTFRPSTNSPSSQLQWFRFLALCFPCFDP
ncbi:hypothetical protein PENSPDRAFT_501170 [Peniophora sp. CONT]|nr:hypothetical protein PENSPDRAFT_501170 [Peniophora sp. CONT]